MIKTRAGWNRSTWQQRQKQVMAIQGLPTALECSCQQCRCGDRRTVILEGIPLCGGCGRPKQKLKEIRDGKAIYEYYGLDHSWFCYYRDKEN